MLDGNELKFGDLLVEKVKGCNSLFMFLSYSARMSNIKLLKIPYDIYIPSVPVWKPDYESFLDSRYVRDHGFYRNISIMDYANPDQIKKHNDKATPNLNLGRWLYNCSLYPIDEWSDSDRAKSDAKIVMPYHSGYSYCKELINSVYGYNKKPPYDDMPDAISYAIEEFERKQREERLEKAKLTSEELKEMLNNSCYGVCWPSELIESCERIDKYRKEVEEMYKTLICRDVEFTADLYLKESGRTPDYDKKIFANVYAYDDGSGFDIRFKFYAGREWCFIVHLNDLDAYINDAYHAGEAAFNFIFNRIYDQSNGQITIKSTGANLSRIRHIFEEYDLFKTRKAKDDAKPEAKSPFEAMPKIEKVIFNPPATIVKWKDGTKTIVKCQDDDDFDWEKGLAMAYVKRAFNNERTYYGLFKKNEPDVILPNSNMRYDPNAAKGSSNNCS